MLNGVGVVVEAVDAVKRPGRHIVNGIGDIAPVPVDVVFTPKAAPMRW